ncbi:MAG: sulfatase, partial [Kiritimatiellia bacterium]
MKNVLIILTDQQRKDSLSCYGNPVCRTPNLDRLAASGLRFNRNYVANPICMPSRLCIFTGKNIRNHGLWTNGLLINEQETVAGHFSRQGYATATIGKLHFTPHGSGGENNMESGAYWHDQTFPIQWHGPYWGFEHVELILGHNHAPKAHYGEWFYKNGGTDDMLKLQRHPDNFKTGTRPLPEHLHNSAFVAERSIEFMQSSRQAGKSFFLVASFPDPHAPFVPPADTAETYAPADVVMPAGSADDLASRPPHYREHFQGQWDRGHSARIKKPTPHGVTEAETRDRIAKTYAMVDLVDQNVGKLLGFLTAQGLHDETLVVFTS